MAKLRSQEQWNKALALYITGRSLTEIAEETSIPLSTLKKKSANDNWTEKRNRKRTETELKIEKKIAEQAAENAAEVLEPLRQASTQLVEKALELMPQTERAYEIRALAGAIKDLSQVIRDLNGLLTAKERDEMKNARERLELEKERLKQSDTDGGAEIKFVIEYEEN